MPLLGPGPPELRTVNTYSCCSASIACTCAPKGFETLIHVCAYLLWGCGTVTPILVGACPSVLLVLVRLKGLKHPYIHTTLAPLEACRHEGGWGGGPEQQAPASVRNTRTRQAPASVPNTGHFWNAFQKPLSVVCTPVFPMPFLIAQARLPVPHKSQSSPSKPADMSRKVCTSGTLTLRAEADSQHRSCAQPRVLLPTNFRIQSLASCHCHYLFMGGCMIKG